MGDTRVLTRGLWFQPWVNKATWSWAGRGGGGCGFPKCVFWYLRHQNRSNIICKVSVMFGMQFMHFGCWD